MKEYCVDLEIAKELEKNGFISECHFEWIDRPNINNPIIVNYFVAKSYHYKERFLAPVSDEILKELPNEIKGYSLEIVRYETGPIEVNYVKYNSIDVPEYLINSKEMFYKLSNALAKKWLHLKKEGYIK